jgi:predicted DNA-binding WGR domain protein
LACFAGRTEALFLEGAMQFVQCSFLRYVDAAKNSDKVYVVGLFWEKDSNQFFVKTWWGKFSNPNPTCRSETFKNQKSAQEYFHSRLREKENKGYRQLRSYSGEEFGSIRELCEFWKAKAGLRNNVDLGIGSLEESITRPEGIEEERKAEPSADGGHNNLWKFIS